MPRGGRYALPKRWIDYSCIGDVIEGTKFMCFKVPLSRNFQKAFEPKHLIMKMKEQNITLGMVIDLTNTDRYYNGNEFTCEGIEYVKIAIPGSIESPLPPEELVKQFRDTLDPFLFDYRDREIIVGVHCTHGVNRSGYMVCRYMIDRLGWDPQAAINAFNRARGHKMEKYTQELLALTSLHQEATPAPIAGISRQNIPPVNTEQSPGGDSVVSTDISSGEEDNDKASTSKRKHRHKSGTPSAAVTKKKKKKEKHRKKRASSKRRDDDVDKRGKRKRKEKERKKEPKKKRSRRKEEEDDSGSATSDEEASDSGSSDEGSGTLRSTPDGVASNTVAARGPTDGGVPPNPAHMMQTMMNMTMMMTRMVGMQGMLRTNAGNPTFSAPGFQPQMPGPVAAGVSSFPPPNRQPFMANQPPPRQQHSWTQHLHQGPQPVMIAASDRPQPRVPIVSNEQGAMISPDALAPPAPSFRADATSSRFSHVGPPPMVIDSDATEFVQSQMPSPPNPVAWPPPPPSSTDYPAGPVQVQSSAEYAGEPPADAEDNNSATDGDDDDDEEEYDYFDEDGNCVNEDGDGEPGTSQSGADGDGPSAGYVNTSRRRVRRKQTKNKFKTLQRGKFWEIKSLMDEEVEKHERRQAAGKPVTVGPQLGPMGPGGQWAYRPGQ